MTDFPRYTVHFEADAEADLEAIAAYIAEHQSPEIADRYLARILDRVAALQVMPLRGSVPKELQRYERVGFRQLVHGPHRIIYKVAGSRVAIVLVADGRRDLAGLFEARLLGDSGLDQTPTA